MDIIKINSPLNGEYIGEIESMSKEKVDLIINNLKNNFKNFKNTKIEDRIEKLIKVKKKLKSEIDKLAKVLNLEIAKPYDDCISEISRSIDMIDLFIENMDILNSEKIKEGNLVSEIHYEPKGLILCIAPFNYPINLSISKIVPALLLGNVVLLKPPTQGSIVCSKMISIFNEYFSENEIAIVTGKGSVIGDFLNTHPQVDLINFTGSTGVGKSILKLAPEKEHIQELGGKDAAIVLDDADINLAANEIVSGAFSYAGQRCTAIKRVLVSKNIKKELSDLIVEKVRNISVNPLIDMKSADFVQGLIDDAKIKGAKILIGDKRENNLIYPCVIDDVKLDMRIAFEEPFGPVLPIIEFDSIDEAINISNMSEYGLQTAIFTKNIEYAKKIASLIEVGTVQINRKTNRGPDVFPFLGIKDSGRGVQGILWSLKSVANLKSIVYKEEL